MSLKVSVIIPSYNEEDDIRDTMQSMFNLSYVNKEIIVVDDSTDATPTILKELQKQHNFILLTQQQKRGLNGAYNMGIRAATGEIVIMFTADNRPDPDYIEKILPHYEQGADYVVIQATALNSEKLFARLVEALHQRKFATIEDYDPLWSEGFSARRQALLDVGLMPENYPVSGGTDNLLSQKLKNHGFKKKLDLSLVMKHVVPTKLAAIWHQQVWRGKAGPEFNYAVYHQSLSHVLAKAGVKAFLHALTILTIVPLFFQSARLVTYSKKKGHDFFPFVAALAVLHAARMCGELEGAIAVINLKISSLLQSTNSSLG